MFLRKIGPRLAIRQTVRYHSKLEKPATQEENTERSSRPGSVILGTAAALGVILATASIAGTSVGVQNRRKFTERNLIEQKLSRPLILFLDPISMPTDHPRTSLPLTQKPAADRTTTIQTQYSANPNPPSPDANRVLVSLHGVRLAIHTLYRCRLRQQALFRNVRSKNSMLAHLPQQCHPRRGGASDRDPCGRTRRCCGSGYLWKLQHFAYAIRDTGRS